MIDLLDRLSVNAKRRSTANTPGQYLSPAAGSSGGEAGDKASPPLPRALILTTTETFCAGCGARYRAPEPVVLAEYSDNCLAHLRSQQDFRRYPTDILREHRTRNVQALACERCF